MARLATAESLVERGTFCIDQSTYLKTIDKVVIDGRFYGCQMPFLSVIYALVYIPFYLLGINFAGNGAFLSWFFTWLFSGAALAGSAVLLGQVFYRESSDAGNALKFALLFFFASLYLSYSVFPSHHLTAGLLIIAALYLTVFTLPKTNSLFIAGFLASAAAMIDPPPGLAFALAFFLYLIFKTKSLKFPAFFALGSLIPGLIHLFASLKAFGAFFPPNIVPEYFKYYGAVFNESNLSGVVSNNSLNEIAVYAFHCLFGHRGLFVYTPLLLFAVWGLVIAWKQPDKRPLAAVITFPILLTLAFYIWRSKNYGGDAYGVRFFLPFVPALFIMIIFIRDKLQRKVIRYLFLAAFLISFLFVIVGLYRPTSDEDLGYNSLTANLFYFQAHYFPALSEYTWKPVAALANYDPDVLEFMGGLLHNFGSSSVAEAVYRKTLELDGQNSNANLVLGNLLLNQGDIIDARKYLEKALSLNSGRPIAILALAKVLNALGQSDSSNAFVDRYLSIGDSITATINPALKKQKLDFYGKFGRDKALALKVDNFLAAGNLDSAKMALNSISPEADDTDFAIVLRARYYLCSGDSAEAIDFLSGKIMNHPELIRPLQKEPHISAILDEAVQKVKGAER